MTREKIKSISTGPTYFPIMFCFKRIRYTAFWIYKKIINFHWKLQNCKWGICILYYEMMSFKLYVHFVHLYIYTYKVKMDNFLSPLKVIREWAKWKIARMTMMKVDNYQRLQWKPWRTRNIRMTYNKVCNMSVSNVRSTV